jgi:hypothetical protein
MYWACRAMFAGVAVRVSLAACSGGRLQVPASGSCSTTPAVSMAPSHSRTYRSFRPALEAICALVPGGMSAMASNRPVRWPTEVIRQSAPALRAPNKRSSKAASLASSSGAACAVMVFLPVDLPFYTRCGGISSGPTGTTQRQLP